MKRALIYGAGNIGRGFIGQLFSESSYEVTFLDINETVINALNEDREYPLTLVAPGRSTEVTVKNVRGVLAKDKDIVAAEIEKADIMAVSIGVRVLPYIAENLAEGFKRRIEQKRPLDLIICENLLHADSFLRNLILEKLPDNLKPKFNKYIGLVEASIGRMVPVMTEEQKQGNPLRVIAEEYAYLPVDKDAFKTEIPEIKGLYPYSPFSLFIERKLYMHNMGHALTAYLGNLYGCKTIAEACGIGEIRYIVYNALVRTANALSKKYSYDLSSLLDHASNLVYRFSNVALGDTVARVGGDPIRKLKAGDRFSGAVELLNEMDIENGYTLLGIAAALMFKNDNDAASVEVHIFTKEHGARATIDQYCSIQEVTDINFACGIHEKLKEGESLIEVIAQIESKENAKQIFKCI